MKADTWSEEIYMRFYMVEDDRTSHDRLLEILCLHGECVIATNGEEALKAFIQS